MGYHSEVLSGRTISAARNASSKACAGTTDSVDAFHEWTGLAEVERGGSCGTARRAVRAAGRT
jgi:hypothetical protein